MGISKRELLCDYYPDELEAVFRAWAQLHGGCGEMNTQIDTEPVSVTAFLEM